MAIFKKSKKEVEQKPEKIEKISVDDKKEAIIFNFKNNPIVRPHITEKSLRGEEIGQYVFIVRKDTTKKEVAQSISKMHKVTVEKVRMIRQEKPLTGFRGKSKRDIITKKAIVTLKKGDKIDSGVK